jgi:hypothetical protein
MKIQMMSLVLARQKHAVNALIKLQSYGVTDNEIINIYRFLDSARLENARRMVHTPLDSSLLKFDGWNGSNFAPI